MDAASLMGNRADAFHLPAIMRNRLKEKNGVGQERKKKELWAYCANVCAIRTDARRVGESVPFNSIQD